MNGVVLPLYSAQRVPYRLDLYPTWRRRAGNQQHNDHVFRQIGRTNFLQNAAAQLGNRLHGNLVGTLAMAFFLGYYVGID